MRGVSKETLMNKKTKPQISAAMTAAGRLTAHWALIDQKVIALGGQPEDLYLLGDAADSEVAALVDTTAKKLVQRGRVLRAASGSHSSSIRPQMMFKPMLAPKYLFLLNKSGADAPSLLSAMDGTYFVSSHTRGMMEQSEHFIIGPPEIAPIGVFTCDQLGVTGWPETDFFGPKGWHCVGLFGLSKCLPDDGPYIRIAHREQELSEWFRVGIDPIPFDGCSSVWSVGHVSDVGRDLVGWRLFSVRRLLAGNLIALRLAR